MRASKFSVLVACASVAIASAACSAEHGGAVLSVAVATGLVPGPEFTYVQTEVSSASAGASALPLHEARAIFTDEYARGRNVAQFRSMSAGTYVVVVRLLRTDGTALVSRRVQIELSGDYSLVVHLTRDCVGAVCPLASGSPALSECLAGSCVDPRCNPPDPAYCPNVTFCLRDEDCAPSAACAQSVCSGGICEAQPIENACPLLAYCDPTPVTGGCVGVVEADAGRQDATLVDAGAGDATVDAEIGIDMQGASDAGPPMDLGPASDAGPLCGTICTVESDPCLFGYWDCAASGSPVCTEINFKPEGSPCGGGGTCTADHECVLCDEGAACSFYCYAGTESCSGGVRSCSVDGTSFVAPGSPYSTSPCYGDDACGSGLVCDEFGSPVACVDGAACNEGCLTGHVTCDVLGSRCVLDDMSPPGTSCGFNQVCNGAGDCVACAAGSACTPPEPLCQTGVTQCASGTPTCLVTNRPTGYSCGFFDGSNHVCDADSQCNACNTGAACIDSANFCRTAYTSCGTGNAVCTASTSMRVDPGTTCDVDKVCDWDATCKHCVPGETCTQATGCAQGEYVCDFANGAACTGTPILLPPATACATGQCNGINECCAPISATAISRSSAMACYITTDMRLHCRPTASYSTVDVPNAVDVSVGYLHGCALSSDGTVSCWGNNDWGQLGFVGASTTSAVSVSLPEAAHQVRAGGASTCAIVGAARDVYCWGDEENVRTGSGSEPTTPTLIAGLTGTSELAVGWAHFCARLASGDVKCWGSNFEGELGIGTVTSSFVATPTAVLGLHDAVDIDLTYSRTCAVRATGVVVCWGSTDTGAPSQSTPTSQALPFSNAVSVEVTSGGTRCARQATGELWCWGQGVHAGVGADASSMTIPPTRVHFIPTASALDMDDDGGCALVGATSQPMCWGVDSAGAFSSGGTHHEPVSVCP